LRVARPRLFRLLGGRWKTATGNPRVHEYPRSVRAGM
jgi:hypothetical protein